MIKTSANFYVNLYLLTKFLTINLVNEEDRVQFKNMIILFGELVRSMFSYEKYLKKLISRGDLPMRLSKTNLGNQQDFTLLCKELHTLPRHIQYVLSLPLTDNHKVGLSVCL